MVDEAFLSLISGRSGFSVEETMFDDERLRFVATTILRGHVGGVKPQISPESASSIREGGPALE